MTSFSPVWIALLALASLSGEAGNPAEAGAPFIRNFSPRDCNAAPQNWEVVQNPAGVLFVANGDGILEFDGARMRLIRTAANTMPRSLAVDAQGRVLVGATGEIGYLAPDATGQAQFVSLMDKLDPGDRTFSHVVKTHATRQGVFFTSPEALMRYADGRMKVWKPVGGFHLSFAVDDRVFIREPGRGLLEVRGDDLVLVPGTECFKDEKILFMVPWQGDLLIGTRKMGLLRFRNGTLERFPTEVDSQLTKDLLYRGAVMADGRLVLATLKGGAYLLDARGKLLGRLSKATGLRDDTVLQVFPDRQGGLCLALNDGFARAEISSPLTTFGSPSGLRGGTLALERHQGNLYAATDLGVFRLEPGGSFHQVAGIQDQTWALLSAADVLLAANNEGLYEIRDDRASLIKGSFPGPMGLLRSSRNPSRLYVGLERGLSCLKLRAGHWVEEGNIPGLMGALRTLYEAADGSLWAGTSSQGVYRITLPPGWPGVPAKVELFGMAEGLPATTHNFVYGAFGEPVFATHKGILRFVEATRRFVPDARFSGLFGKDSRWVFGLTQDPSGRLWMYSKDLNTGFQETGAAVPGPGGVWHWDPTPTLPLADTPVECLRCDRDGVLWVGASEGIFRLDNQAPAPEKPWSALVRGVTQGGDRLQLGAAGAAPQFNYSGRRIRFEFACPSFDKLEANRSQVFLEGYDHDWSPWMAGSELEYTNLKEGAYRFRVRARNVHGNLSQEDSYPFRVLPPWYRTFWAYGLYVLGFAALGYGILRRRLWKVEQEKQVLEAKILSRTQQLAESNASLVTAQEQIHRLMASPAGMLEDVPAWAMAMGEDIQRTLGATSLDIYRLGKDGLEPFDPASVAPPMEQVAEALEGRSRFGDLLLVPGRGPTGEPKAILVVRGLEGHGPERQLLNGFASQLGSALEMVQIRVKLAAAEAHRGQSLEELQGRGVETLLVCPRCGRCQPHFQVLCAEDGAPMEIPGILPYRILDRYRFTRLLGEGGMGTVFEAQDENLDRQVAVKLMKPELFNNPTARLRFEREARTLVQVNHPGVVTVFDSGEVGDGSMFLIMERLLGLDVGMLLRHFGPGSPRQVARLLRQSAEALEAAHRIHIVHRDITPQNLFLVSAPDGFQVKLLDFGLAKGEQGDSRLTKTGYMMGTPTYMAPEQILGNEADYRSDGYALATVIYGALLGRPTVAGATLHEIIQDILYRPPQPPTTLASWLPPEVDAAFAAALAKDPDQRPKSLRKWAWDLAEQLEGLTGPTAGWPDPLPSTEPSPARAPDAPPRTSLLPVSSTLALDLPTAEWPLPG